MSSNRPTPPDQPDLPQRHRISLEKLRKESAETQLWDLEGDESTARAIIPREPRRMTKDEPVESEPDPFAAAMPSEYDDVFPSPDDFDDPAVTKPAPPRPSRQDMPKISPLLEEIGELDDWDDDDADAPVLPMPPHAVDAPADQPVADIHAPPPPSADAEVPAPTTASAPPKVLEETLASTSQKAQNRRKASISFQEKASLAVLALLIVAGAGFFLINAFRDLPRIVDPYEMPTLPVEGSHLAITAAESYWRLPVTTGPDADVVQRGIALIPVLEITVSGQNAVLRLQFHDSEGSPAGDPITQAVRGSTQLTIPSTAGLEDLNIHNAYRTGLVEPWTVEILEAPAGTTAGSAFNRLATFPVSILRR